MIPVALGAPPAGVSVYKVPVRPVRLATRPLVFGPELPVNEGSQDCLGEWLLQL